MFHNLPHRMHRRIALALLGLVVVHKVSADSISVSKKCFAVNEVIPVTFKKDDDADLTSSWIGIYATNRLDSENTLPAADLWVKLCGTTTCDPANNPTSGTVRFRSNKGQDWVQEWPLSKGTYRAFLTRGGRDTTWPKLARSIEFRVGNCSVKSPTRTPVRRPTTPRPTVDVKSAIASARSDIEALIKESPFMAGKFLRLAFHDCVGGCDGCIDMTNLDNNGLQGPVSLLNDVVERYANKGLSRTDIWMLSAVVSADFTEVTVGLAFPFNWIGRKTCYQLNKGNCGKNSKGQPTLCTATTGPHRVMPHGDIDGTRAIEKFMADQYGMDAQQTAALMGAHSIGAMRDVNVGFDGRRGWDSTNHELDSGYFVELVGDSNRGPSNWEQAFHNNDDLVGIPGRFQFEANVDGRGLTMLNSDIALVRKLVRGENLMSDGSVTCTFKGTDACSSDTPFFPFIQAYAQSRGIFLVDFRDALDMMIDNGYSRHSDCESGKVCRLKVRS